MNLALRDTTLVVHCQLQRGLDLVTLAMNPLVTVRCPIEISAVGTWIWKSGYAIVAARAERPTAQ